MFERHDCRTKHTTNRLDLEIPVSEKAELSLCAVWALFLRCSGDCYCYRRPRRRCLLDLVVKTLLLCYRKLEAHKWTLECKEASVETAEECSEAMFSPPSSCLENERLLLAGVPRTPSRCLGDPLWYCHKCPSIFS